MMINRLKRLSEIDIDEMMVRKIIEKNDVLCQRLDDVALDIIYSDLKLSFFNHVQNSMSWDIDIISNYYNIKVRDAYQMMLDLTEIPQEYIFNDRMMVLINKGETLAYRLDWHPYCSNQTDLIADRLYAIADEIIEIVEDICRSFHGDYYDDTYQVLELIENQDMYDDYFIDDDLNVYEISHC